MTDLALRRRVGPGTRTVSGPRRRLFGLIVALAVLLGLLVGSMMLGSTAIAPTVVWDALFHRSNDIDQFAIRDFRLPRTVVGLVVGMALGVSGALIQALTRNPLADPDMLGLNAGASFAVTVAVGLFGVRDIQSYMWFAFAGALIVTLVVLALGSTRRGQSPVMMVLAGVCVGAVLRRRFGTRADQPGRLRRDPILERRFDREPPTRPAVADPAVLRDRAPGGLRGVRTAQRHGSR